MSVVNNYVLKLSGFTDYQEAAVMMRLSDLLKNSFVRVDQLAGGSKHMEISIYLAALNYVEPETVVELLTQAIQERKPTRALLPRSIQLFCQRDHDPESGLKLYYEGPVNA